MAKLSDSDKQKRRAIRDAKSIVEQALKADVNEAETRRRIERIFENVMGYDPFVHLSRERAVRGAGETEHVDFALQIEAGESARPIVMVEIKRVAVDLSRKHLKQVTSYAIDAGCEWTLLTNAREWRLYHVAFGQPPETREIRTWDLLTDEIADLSEHFELISLRSLQRGSLDELWQKTSILLPRNLLEAIVCEDTLNSIRRQLRKKSGVLLPPEDIVKGVRGLLNESAAAELRDIKISLPKKRVRRTTSESDSSQPSQADLDTFPPEVADQSEE
ncbi:MAG: type I restriction enzyme HsdR N-terminal domain-containing protein [Planctomycetes bacterium]|nr:type I restriction enzyme HsdR N-terminal domain-containing protein [Planctomycetota bacterium]